MITFLGEIQYYDKNGNLKSISEVTDNIQNITETTNNIIADIDNINKNIENINIDLNIENGYADGSLEQSDFVYTGEDIVYSDGSIGLKNGSTVPGGRATGFGSVAFGGMRFGYSDFGSVVTLADGKDYIVEFHSITGDIHFFDAITKEHVISARINGSAIYAEETFNIGEYVYLIGHGDCSIIDDCWGTSLFSGKPYGPDINEYGDNEGCYPVNVKVTKVINNSSENWRGEEFTSTYCYGRTPTSAEGNQSFAVGGSVHAYGDWSAAIGKDSKAYQKAGFAIGASRVGRTKEEFDSWYWDSVNNVAKNGGKGKDTDGNVMDYHGDKYENSFSFAFAGGGSSNALARDSMAFGGTAYGLGSKSLGNSSETYGEFAFALGLKSVAFGNHSFAGGAESKAAGNHSFAFGYRLNPTGSYATSFGIGGKDSDGNFTYKNEGEAAFMTGKINAIGEKGIASFVSGYSNNINTGNSASFGKSNIIKYSTGLGGAQENNFTTGYNNKVYGGQNNSIFGHGNSIGSENSANIGIGNFISGMNNKVSVASKANNATAFGVGHEVNNSGAFVTGQGNKTSAIYQTVVGQFNSPTADAFVVGWGSSSADADRKNVFTVGTTGNVNIAGNLTIGGNTLKIAQLASKDGSALLINNDLTVGANTTRLNKLMVDLNSTPGNRNWIDIGATIKSLQENSSSSSCDVEQVVFTSENVGISNKLVGIKPKEESDGVDRTAYNWNNWAPYDAATPWWYTKNILQGELRYGVCTSFSIESHGDWGRAFDVKFGVNIQGELHYFTHFIDSRMTNGSPDYSGNLQVPFNVLLDNNTIVNGVACLSNYSYSDINLTKAVIQINGSTIELTPSTDSEQQNTIWIAHRIAWNEFGA